jgi:hypothetical protein
VNFSDASFSQRNALGIGSVALAWLLRQDRLLATPADVPRNPQSFDLKPKTPQPGRARAMISLFMHGGPSHVDLLDPKPELSRRSGEDYPGEITYSFVDRASKKLFGSPWEFRRHGAMRHGCLGTSPAFLPHRRRRVPDPVDAHRHQRARALDLVHEHRPAQPGRPALGSWITYGLGSESQNLPAYVVLTDPGRSPRRRRPQLVQRLDAPALPGNGHPPREPRILNLDTPAELSGDIQRQNLEFLA